MKQQCDSKMYFLLLAVYVAIGGLLGVPVDEDPLSQLSVNTPVKMHTLKEQTLPSVTPPLSAASTPEHSLIPSTARDDGTQGFQLAGKSLAGSIDDHGSGVMGTSTTSGKEKASTSSKHSLHDLVSTQPTEMALDHFGKHIRVKSLDLASAKPFLPGSEVSGEDEDPSWYSEVTTPIFTFSNQPPLSNVKIKLQNSSTFNHTHLFDETELHTLSPEVAESGTFKPTSVEQVIETQSGSVLSETISTHQAFGAESDVAAYLEINATSFSSGVFKRPTTSWWSSGSPSGSKDSWQLPDVLEGEYSVPPSVGPPDVSEDVYSAASSDIYSTAASSVGTNWLPDVSEDVYSTAASSDIYSTAASSVGTNWLPDVSEDVYSAASSTAASSAGTNWPPDVSEDMYSASTATDWPSYTSGAEFYMAHTQTILDEFATTNGPLNGSEYYSTISSFPKFQPSPSEALSPPSIFEELATSLDSTSYQGHPTSSPTNGIYSQPNVSEMQLSMMTTVDVKSESISFATWSSHSPIEQTDPLLLQFEILDKAYTDSLNDSSSEAYQELETLVKRTLEPLFYARYGDSFLRTKILSFVNGSVKVESEVMFQDHAVLPSSSDIVRTVLTHVYRTDPIATALEINASSIVCNGYSLTNLESERILIEFTALSTGFGPWSDEATFYQELLQHLSSWVVEALEEKYPVQEFNIGRVIRIQGDVNIQGTALLTTPVHVNEEVLLLLNNLVDKFVDLRSLKVNGSGMNVGVLPVSFMITNREYNSTLRDSRSAYFCSLGKAVTQALQMILKPKYSHFMQAVTKPFRRGSVISSSDLIFLNTPPASHEVLDVFFNSVDTRGFLAGSDFAVDAYSFTVAGARLDQPYQRLHFPGFGIAIILLCGLAIITVPVLAFMCWKYRFCVACQKSFAFEAWDVERENASVQIALPEMAPESYKLHEEYADYSFAP